MVKLSRRFELIAIVIATVISSGATGGTSQVGLHPSDGARGGHSFTTTLRLKHAESSYWTSRVTLTVPQGVTWIRPSPKSGWEILVVNRSHEPILVHNVVTNAKDEGPGTIIFQAALTAVHEPDDVIEFTLSMKLGCDFRNTADASEWMNRHVLWWRATQDLSPTKVSSVNAVGKVLHWSSVPVLLGPNQHNTPGMQCAYMFVDSDAACVSVSANRGSIGNITAKGTGVFGMHWLGVQVPPKFEEKPVGVEVDRDFDGHDPRAHDHSQDYRKGHGGTGRAGLGHAGMMFDEGPGPGIDADGNHPYRHHFGRSGKPGRSWARILASHRFMKVARGLGLVLLLLFGGAALVAVGLAVPARMLFLLKSSRPLAAEALLPPSPSGETQSPISSPRGENQSQISSPRGEAGYQQPLQVVQTNAETAILAAPPAALAVPGTAVDASAKTGGIGPQVLGACHQV